MTNSVSSHQPDQYAIAAFFSEVGGIELGFEQTNEFDKYARQTYQLNYPETFWDRQRQSSYRCYRLGSKEVIICSTNPFTNPLSVLSVF